MKRSMLLPAFTLVTAASLLVSIGGCGSDPDPEKAGEGASCEPAAAQCADSLVCDPLAAGGHVCARPVIVLGQVFDAKTKAGVKGAHVLGADEQATVTTDVAVTDAMGNYVLKLSVPREADGKPVATTKFTLRASASGYQTFPSGLRTALPITVGDAMATAAGWSIKTTLTDISLLGLPMAQQGLPSISGKVLSGDARQAGVLVVAEGAGPGISAISDKAGAYAIFNVPVGDYTVKGYAAGLQLKPAIAKVAAAPLTGVDLAVSADALGTVSGSVNIVNAPGGSLTSVVLVVASTFNDTFVRGEVPRGLRSPLSGPPNVSGAFSIPNVPEGKYKVLAAFENDNLVRDPDLSISGTQIVEVTMPTPGMAVDLPSSFKITEALQVFGPGAGDPEPVKAAPMLRWADDSSEDEYNVFVYNAYGDLVWCLSSMAGCAGGPVPGVSGGNEVSVTYAGPLDPGMYYQFRATSIKKGGPISTTEDLRGVFYVEP